MDPSVRTRLTTWAERTGTALDLRVGGTFPTKPPRRAALRESSVIVLRNSHRVSRGGFEERALRLAGLGIYELDDGLPWDNGRLHGLGRWWKVPFRRDRIAVRSARAADRVIAGNHVLADWASQYCEDVRIIPTCVDPDDYNRKVDFNLNATPTLIWVGSEATEFEIVDIAPALLEVHRQTNARLVLLGAANRPIPSGMELFTTRIPWTLESQKTLLAQADIGLMPLSNGVYQQAKCGYKLLQYAAAGLPAVASPVGVNSQMLAQGLGVAAEPEQWVEKVVALISANSIARQRIGQTAFTTCVSEYSYTSWEPSWRKAVAQ